MAFGGKEISWVDSQINKLQAAFERALEKASNNDVLQNINLDVASENSENLAKALLSNVSFISDLLQDIVAVDQEITTDVRQMEIEKQATESKLDSIASKIEKMLKVVDRQQAQAIMYSKEIEIEKNKHENKSIVQGGSVGLAICGALVTPFVPPLGIGMVACGTASTVGFGVSKMENSDNIRRCTKEVENCVAEIICFKLAGAMLTDWFFKLVTKQMLLVYIQKQVQGFKACLIAFRNEGLKNLAELKQQTAKLGIAKVRIQRANDLRKSICDIATNLKSHLRSYLLGACEAIDNTPGARGGLKDRWNNILQPPASNEAHCSTTDDYV